MMQWNDPPPNQTASESPSLTAQTRVLQIVVGALVMGVLLFGTFVVFTALKKPPGGVTMSYIAIGFSALMIVLHVIVPGVVERAALRNQSIDTGPQALLGVYFTRTIIAAALLDGAAFLSLVAVMQEHRPWVLGVTAVLVVLMIMQIPSRTRIEQWLEMRMMERDQGA
jgi:hypothetical protein